MKSAIQSQKDSGVVVPLKTALEESEKFVDWSSKNAEVFNIALKLEGLNKNTGVHPSGIAISFDKITGYLLNSKIK